MKTFWAWMNEGNETNAKRGLYPSLYTQYYHYPPQDVITWSADAITYMDDEDYNFKVYYGKKFIPHTWKTIGSPGKMSRT